MPCTHILKVYPFKVVSIVSNKTDMIAMLLSCLLTSSFFTNCYFKYFGVYYDLKLLSSFYILLSPSSATGCYIHLLLSCVATCYTLLNALLIHAQWFSVIFTLLVFIYILLYISISNTHQSIKKIKNLK